jgi:hypothetical protein
MEFLKGMACMAGLMFFIVGVSYVMFVRSLLK